MSELVMLLGGPGDGKIIEYDDTSVIYEEIKEDSDVYTYRRFYTLDWMLSGDSWVKIPRWAQDVFVHTGFDHITEPDIIRSIMTVWRASHVR